MCFNDIADGVPSVSNFLGVNKAKVMQGEVSFQNKKPQ